MKNKLPNALRFARVDEVIECMPLKPDRELIESALLEAMPDAYEASAEDPPEGREYPPEPDAQADRKLALIWDKLTDEVRAALRLAVVRQIREDGAAMHKYKPEEFTVHGTYKGYKWKEANK